MTIAPEYVTPAPQAHRKATVGLRSETGAVLLRTNQQGYGYRLLPEAEGLGVADVENVMEDLATGSTVLTSRLTAGDVFLPIMSRTTSNTALKEMRDQLALALNPAGGVVDVIVEHPNGDLRRRPAYYQSGLSAPSWRGPSAELHGITLDFADPYWKGNERRAEWSLSTVIKPYWTTYPRLPHYPAWLSSSTILGRRQFDVRGDAPAYPIWTHHGGGEDLLIECARCGARTFIQGEVPEGLTIDTRPHVEDITAPGWDPADLWAKVSDDSTLFHLAPGGQEVTMSVVSATGASTLTLTYEEQWMAGY